MPSGLRAGEPRSWSEDVNADCCLMPRKMVRTAWPHWQAGRVQASYPFLNGHLNNARNAQGGRIRYGAAGATGHPNSCLVANEKLEPFPG